MNIGIDVMGGDYAPNAIVLGAIQAYKELPDDVKLTLIGDKEKVLEILKAENFEPSNFNLVHTTEVISMNDHPAKAFSHKKNSSITVGFHMLSKGLIDGFTSAGNTGAMLVGAMFTVKSVPGVIRPGIAGFFPKTNSKTTIILDVGLNPDCKPDVLYQYGILGANYAKHVFQIKKPKVGLLNIGSEKEKGNLLTKASHEAMSGSTDFEFIGNVEGNDLYNTEADVVVCDGFVGNVILKQAEAVYKLIKKRNIADEYFERFNFENIGGTPILGINSNVTIGHGVSNAKAIKNMILQTQQVIEAKLPERFKKIFQ